MVEHGKIYKPILYLDAAILKGIYVFHVGICKKAALAPIQRTNFYVYTVFQLFIPYNLAAVAVFVAALHGIKPPDIAEKAAHRIRRTVDSVIGLLDKTPFIKYIDKIAALFPAAFFKKSNLARIMIFRSAEQVAHYVRNCTALCQVNTHRIQVVFKGKKLRHRRRAEKTGLPYLRRSFLTFKIFHMQLENNNLLIAGQ